MRKLIKMLIKTYRSNCCCLCGSTNQLTHEHKIKASGIKKIFGRDKMLIGTFANADGYRIAQGPKSKEFHFAVPICAACNGSLTQPADLDFDYFHNDLMSLYQRHENINAIINWRIACITPTAKLNMRRYFAKLLCCHIAQTCGFSIPTLSAFAIGKSDICSINIHINSDEYYREMEPPQFAYYGGLSILVDPLHRQPTGFTSALILGPLKYEFEVNYGLTLGHDLEVLNPNFHKHCLEVYGYQNNFAYQGER